MKKYLLSMLAIMMVAFVSVNLVACGDDDNKPSTIDDDEYSIVGEWMGEYEDEDGTDWRDYFVFKSNGTGKWREEYYSGGRWKADDSEDFDYTFNTNSMVLKLYYGDEVETLEVLSLTRTTLKLMDDDGDRLTYTRVN